MTITSNITSNTSIQLSVKGLGKKFYYQWVFKDVTFDAKGGERILLTGPNGSGKSTLIKLLAGQLHYSAGEVKLTIGGKDIEEHLFYRYLTWTGPYFDLHPELNLEEMVQLHFRFKDCLLEDWKDVIPGIGLEKHRHKKLSHFSSGMLHRLKVGLCIFSNTPLLILDEPGTNLDEQNMEFIYQLLDQYLGNRLLLFVSNNPSDFPRFERRIDLGEFVVKPKR